MSLQHNFQEIQRGSQLIDDYHIKFKEILDALAILGDAFCFTQSLGILINKSTYFSVYGFYDADWGGDVCDMVFLFMSVQH